MNKLQIIQLLLCFIVIAGCSDDNLEAPDRYVFYRNDLPSVSIACSDERIAMTLKLIRGMRDTSNSESHLLELLENAKSDGSDANPYSDNDLNQSSKSLISQIGTSEDLFSGNNEEGEEVRSYIKNIMKKQVEEVFPFAMDPADYTTPGYSYLPGIRFFDEKGFCNTCILQEALLGSFYVDRILNHNLSPTVLDAGENRMNNDASVLIDGSNSTKMENIWDEAYGYLHGSLNVLKNPMDYSNNLFLSGALEHVERDQDFKGIKNRILNAFIEGRTAIVNKDYHKRDIQAEIIKEEVSKVIGIRSVAYLQIGKKHIESNLIGTVDNGLAEMSSAHGFIYSLQFTRKPNSNERYFTPQEVQEMLAFLESDLGLYSLDFPGVDDLSEKIAGRFDFTVDQAK